MKETNQNELDDKKIYFWDVDKNTMNISVRSGWIIGRQQPFINDYFDDFVQIKKDTIEMSKYELSSRKKSVYKRRPFIFNTEKKALVSLENFLKDTLEHIRTKEVVIG